MKLISSMVRFIVLLSITLMMCVSFAACTESASSSQSSETETSSQIDSASPVPTSSKSKLASSLTELINQQLQNPDLPDSQRKILSRAKESGGVSQSDYENAWAGYKSCMLDKGYKEILLIKYPNGLYREAPYKQGTSVQEAKYTSDWQNCIAQYTMYVQSIYTTQIGNPNLYASQAQGVVDCLIREKLVPPSYTAEQYSKETTSEDETPTSFNEKDMRVRGCEVGNNIINIYQDDTFSHPW